MYEFTSRVRYSETGPDLKLTIGGLINRMQDCAVFHSESVGRGVKPVGEAETAWLIVSWQIFIKTMPSLGDAITTKTLARRFHGIEADRDFTVRDSRGKLLAFAASRWIYYQFETQMPIRIPDYEIESYGTDPGMDTEPDISLKRAPRHIRLPKDQEPEKGEPILITGQYIDNNGHVNNEQYINMALPYAPVGKTYSEIRVEYSHQAVLKDTLVPHIYHTSESQTVVLKNQEDKVCAVVSLLWYNVNV